MNIENKHEIFAYISITLTHLGIVHTFDPINTEISVNRDSLKEEESYNELRKSLNDRIDPHTRFFWKSKTDEFLFLGIVGVD